MSEETKSPFSVRSRGPTALIVGEVPETARVGLLHLVDELIESKFVDGWIRVARALRRIAREPPMTYNPSYVPSIQEARDDVERLLNQLPWARFFDFCEMLHSNLAVPVRDRDEFGEFVATTSKEDTQVFIAGELERLFLEENLAFTFEGGLVQRKGRRHTAERITRAQMVLGDPRLTSARRHYAKALQFFRHPSKPDYENTAKEAVCAVEAAAKTLFPDAKATTLGDATTWLTGNERGKLPKALAKTFHGVYGFRSGGEGVGHGGGSGGPVTPELAEYTLAVCASQVVLLVDLARQREIEIPF